MQILKQASVLKSAGVDTRNRSVLDYGKIETSMRICSLELFPAGEVANLKVVIDVGANTGLWSRHFLNCVVPETHIAYEPVPAAFQALSQMLKAYPFAEARPVALGNFQGQRTFFVTRDTTGASLLPPKSEMNTLVQGNWDIQEEIQCQADTLDHQLASLPSIDLLKIDVQGAELEVLDGGRSVLSRTRYLLVEFNYMDQYEGGSDFISLHQKLSAEFGFYLHNISRPLIIDSRAIYSDALYINPRFKG